MAMHGHVTSPIKRVLTFLLALGIFTAGLIFFVQDRGLALSGLGVQDPTPSGVGSVFDAPGDPVRLAIPAIGVNTEVEYVGLTEDGAMGIPEKFENVAWYKLGPKPGMPGNAVIAGHLDSKTGPAVFYELENLIAGDEVRVRDSEGNDLVFKVREVKTYPWDAEAPEIFLNDGTKIGLNLITCGGRWDKTARRYDERVVVFTELVR